MKTFAYLLLICVFAAGSIALYGISPVIGIVVPVVFALLLVSMCSMSRR